MSSVKHWWYFSVILAFLEFLWSPFEPSLKSYFHFSQLWSPNILAFITFHQYIHPSIQKLFYYIFLEFEVRRKMDSYRTLILDRRSNPGTDDLISLGKKHKRSISELNILEVHSSNVTKLHRACLNTFFGYASETNYLRPRRKT